jgi:hypothetical protein
MHLLMERIPLLIARASSFEVDRCGNLPGLVHAERVLRDVGVPRDRDRWLRNRRVRELAETWFRLTADPAPVERCLLTCLGHERSTRACVEIAVVLKNTLAPRGGDPACDALVRRHLLRACEFADTCDEWCGLAWEWDFLLNDQERFLGCLSQAERCAYGFFDYLRCGETWRDKDGQKAKPWIARAAGRAVTAHSWLRCASSIKLCGLEDPESLADLDDYLERALELTRTHPGYLEWVRSAALCLGARGGERVMAGLVKAEERIRDMAERISHVSTVLQLLRRARERQAAVVGFDDPAELESYFRKCLDDFMNRGPCTRDWIALVRQLRWCKPDALEQEFMAKAECAVRKASDWEACATQWQALNVPGGLKRAIRCRLKSMAQWRPRHLP